MRAAARRRLCLMSLALLGAACGGGGSPTAPPTPPPPLDVHDVVAVVFYDENGNGALDGNEAGRVPGVLVEVGGRSARSDEATGRAVVTGVPRGSYSAALGADSLPPFYVAGAPATVEVPQPAGQDVRLAADLPIGDNRPNAYMAFGDSITAGEGSTDDTGYRSPLQAMLRAHFGRGDVLDRGAPGTQSAEGAERIARGLRVLKPAYTLTLYGTNDWNDPDCRENPPCFTVDSLRTIVQTVRGARSLPFLATIIPGNPALNSPERNEWCAR